MTWSRTVPAGHGEGAACQGGHSGELSLASTRGQKAVVSIAIVEVQPARVGKIAGISPINNSPKIHDISQNTAIRARLLRRAKTKSSVD